MFHEAKGDSVQIARMYMDSLLVESRVVGAVRPDTSFRFLGETFEMPIMTAALSGLCFGSKKVLKKGISPIGLIGISAIMGMLIYGL